MLSRINPDATVTLLAVGEAVWAVWRETHSRNPALTASNFIIMPDHIHLLLIVNYDIDPNFDVIGWIKDFQRRSEAAINDTGASPRRLWESRFWLVLSFSSRQLKAIRRYIKLNPARALWKTRHPNRFVRLANVRHPVLDASR